MSASKKNQLRKDVNLEKISKQEKEQLEELKLHKKYKRVTILIVCIILVVTAVSLLYLDELPFMSGSLHRKLTAVSVGDIEYTAADYYYYFTDTASEYNETFNQYIELLGLDSDVAYDDVPLSDGLTWADYLDEATLNAMKETAVLASQANAAGYTLDEEDAKAVEDTITETSTYIINMGYSSDDYFEVYYGKGVTEEVVRKNLTRSRLASEYADHVFDSSEYSDTELETFYQDNADSIDAVDYYYFFVSGVVSINASEEEQEAAMDEAYKNATEFVERLENGEKFGEICADYATETTKERYENDPEAALLTERTMDSIAQDFDLWLFEEGRTKGDVYMMEGDPDETFYGYFVIQFLNRERCEYNTVNIRRIQVTPNATADDGSTTDENWETALSDAESIIEHFIELGGDEAAFTEMVALNSDDTATYLTGGLYEDVYHNELETAINDWIFNSSRKPGDYEIIKGESAYQIVYFVEESLPRWQTQALDSLRQEVYDEWYEEIAADYSITTHKLGMFYAKH